MIRPLGQGGPVNLWPTIFIDKEDLMVRVASLASFPRHVIDREFYAHVPLAVGEDDSAELARRRDRQRKRRERKEQKEKQTGIPSEVLLLLRRNGGAV